ncbi:MAG: AEC family transporter [Alphaproteobacteria bacterium]
MQVVLEIVIPVFALILCGYLVGRTRLLTDDGIKGINNLVFYVILPGLIFRTMSSGAFRERFDIDIVLAYFSAALGLFAAALLLARYVFRLKTTEQPIFAMGATFSNTALMAISIVYLAYGEAGLVPLMILFTVHPLIMIILPTILLEVARTRERGQGDAHILLILQQAVLGVVTNPVILGMVAGIAWGFAGWPMPKMLDQFTKFLSDATATCALFGLGAALTRYRVRGNLKQSFSMVALKLLALPTLVWLTTYYVFEVDHMWAQVAIIMSSMPTGASVFILASRYETYIGRATSAVLISTALSIVSASILLSMFAPAR